MERREHWSIAPYRPDTVVVNLRNTEKADGSGGSYRYVEIADCHRAGKSEKAERIAAMIVDDHNQHATLVEQRDLLASALRQVYRAATNVASYDRALADIKKLAKDAFTTVEQVSSSATSNNEQGKGRE